MTDMLEGDELIYRGKYSLQVKNKEKRALQSVMRLLVYPRERIVSSE